MEQSTINNLKTGDKITVFYLYGTGNTKKMEYTIRGVISKPGEHRKFEVVERGRRKKELYTPSIIHLVLFGHDLPLKCDTEFNKFWIDAQFNIVIESKEIALVTLQKSLLPISPYHKKRVFLFTPTHFKPTSEIEGIEVYNVEGY